MIARHALLASLAVVAVGAPPAAAVVPSGAVPPAATETVTTSLQATAQVAVYDPDDRLDRSGDTHELHILLADGDGGGIVFLSSYECGPHDPAKTPAELGCTPAEVPNDSAEVTDRTVAAEGDTIRWRATTTAGPLVLTLSGGVRTRWVPREWRYAEGTSRESGREVSTRYTGPAIRGTFAGLELAQPVAWRDAGSWTRSRTVARTGRGPALPLPVVPPPGTGPDGGLSVAESSATWVRPLGDGEVEVGTAQVSDAGPEAPPNRTWAAWGTTRQQCDPGEEPVVPPQQPAPGLCDVTDWPRAYLNPSQYTVDPARGTAWLRGTVDWNLDPPGQERSSPVSASWRGRGPVGVHRVDVFLEEPGTPRYTTTVSGVRWLRPSARLTFDGEPLTVVSASMFAFRERTVSTSS